MTIYESVPLYGYITSGMGSQIPISILEIFVILENYRNLIRMGDKGYKGGYSSRDVIEQPAS